MSDFSIAIRSARAGLLSGACLMLGASLVPAHAQPVADFYKGKQITVVVGSSPGGGYDLQARMFARFMGDHIPGKPSMVVNNMPGAGSLTATNHLYNLAPKDGTTIGVVQRGMLTAKFTIPSGVRFDVEKFNWLGNLAPEIATVIAWHSSPIKTTDDLFKQEFIVGGSGPTLDPETVPRLMNALIGTKFKIVSGYPGTTEILLAMERGELHGLADLAWSNVKRRTDLTQDGKIRVLMQSGLQKAPDLPNVPLALDYIKNDTDRKVMELLFVQKTVARPLVAPPDMSSDRVAALRKAFLDMTKDKGFLDEAEKLKVDVEPATGEEIQAIIAKIAATPTDIAEKLAAAITPTR